MESLQYAAMGISLNVHTMPEHFEKDDKFDEWASRSHENVTFFSGRFWVDFESRL